MSSRHWFKRSPPNEDPRRARSPGWIGPSLEAGDRHTLRLQFVFFVLAVLLLTLILELIRSPASVSDNSSHRTLPCENGDPRDPVTGLCVDPVGTRPSPSCEPNALKTDQCVCDGGRHVDRDGHCVLPDPAQRRCDTARSIIRQCGQKRGGKTSDQCSALEIFKESALDDHDVESILAGFPDTMTVHFDENEPRSTAPSEALKKALAERRDALRGASRIFLLGRADNGSGSATGNDKMAQRRLQAVRAAILSGVTGKEREILNARIIDFGLGGNREMDLERFAKRYTRILDAGDARVTRLLDHGLASLRGGKLTPAEKKRLSLAINRSVQLIIVDPMCDLDSPPTSDVTPTQEPV